MGLKRSTELLAAATATNSAPTVVTDGVAIPSGAHRAALRLISTAGSGTMTVTIRMWGWDPESTKWLPLSIGADSAEGDTVNTSGWMNGGNAVVEVAANSLQHYETLEDLGHFARLYAQIVAIGGTATAVDLDATWDWTRRHR